MERWFFLALVAWACSACTADPGQIDENVLARETVVLETFDVSAFNDALVDDLPTADVAFYVLESGPTQWERLGAGIERAQRIFANAGIQLRVSQAKLIRVPEAWLTLDPFEIAPPEDLTEPPRDPDDLYARLNQRNARLTDRTSDIVSAVVSHYETPDNGVTANNAVHVITVAEARIPYYDWNGSEWVYKTAGTGGMSFPPYYFADRIPEATRGFISLSSSGSRTLAHELGHKLINVSHEGGETCPAFTANGEHLMLYGNGETIGTGEEGRWHRERLHLSPFLYREVDGRATWANHFQDGGIYRDRLYGNFAIDPPCGLGETE